MRFVGAGLVVICLGCTIDARGMGGALSDATATDAAIDSAPGDAIFPLDDTAPPPCDETACGVLPAGAKRVALVDRSVACPDGFDSIDVVEETAGDACGCSCSLTSAPTCPSAGAIATSHGDTGCGTSGPTVTCLGSDVCSSIGTNYSLPIFLAATPPAASGGACGATPTTNAAAVSRARRVCEPRTDTCVSPICGAASGECIEVAGSCPPAFSNARRIGSSASVACPTCSCAMSAISCTGTFTLYDTDCAGTKVASIRADGTCITAPSGGGTFTHFKYAPNPTPTATCGASYATAPGTRAFAGERNLCCR